MQPDAKRIVEEGYDRIAHLHAEWAARVRSEERARYLAAFCARVPAGASVLELGCGAGGAVTDALAARYHLTAIDLSRRSIEAARLRTPLARFLHEDMTGADFPAASFAGIVGFYSILHVPREEQAALLSRIASWLQVGGLFMAALGTADEARSYEDNWLGVRWSGVHTTPRQRAAWCGPQASRSRARWSSPRMKMARRCRSFGSSREGPARRSTPIAAPCFEPELVPAVTANHTHGRNSRGVESRLLLLRRPIHGQLWKRFSRR